MALPPDVGEASFAQALREFAAAVGQDWVFSGGQDLDAYNDAYTPFSVEPTLQKTASAAVAPSTVEQVQQIVRTANKYKIPLYTVSTGRNLGYGGASPTLTGSVIVDLKRMDRVLEVNIEQGYVMVEPGVNFLELYRYMEEHNYPFMVSTPEPGWGSPVGNALDHGVSFIVGDNFATARGMEVVLPSGELLRTGMGALPVPHLWNDYPYGYGPYINGIFSQSNFGIVTKMGFALVRKPEMQAQFTVTSGKSEDLYPLIATVQAMREEGLLYLTSVSSPIRSPMSPPGQAAAPWEAKAKALLSSRDGGSHAAWDALARDSGQAASIVTGSLRGPARVVQATIDHARDQFAKIAGAKFVVDFQTKFPLDLESMPPHERPQFGVPSLWPFSSLAMGDTRRGMYFFSPVCRATAEDLFAFRQVLREIVLDHADPGLREPFLSWGLTNTVYPRAYIFTLPFPITSDAAANKKARELYSRLIDTCGAKGYGEYRGHVAFQTEVMDRYSFNDHALRRFCETIKDAIDPNGILAPGKNGIWPRRLRGRAA